MASSYSVGSIQSRRPGLLGQFKPRTVNPIIPFLTMLYFRAQRILTLARDSHRFHMVDIYIARQALHLVILLNDFAYAEDGLDSRQMDEREILADDLVELETAMRGWSTTREFLRIHKNTIKRYYNRFFRKRFYFENSRDLENDTIFQRLFAYDMRGANAIPGLIPQDLMSDAAPNPDRRGYGQELWPKADRVRLPPLRNVALAVNRPSLGLYDDYPAIPGYNPGNLEGNQPTRNRGQSNPPLPLRGSPTFLSDVKTRQFERTPLRETYGLKGPSSPFGTPPPLPLRGRRGAKLTPEVHGFLVEYFKSQSWLSTTNPQEEPAIQPDDELIKLRHIDHASKSRFCAFISPPFIGGYGYGCRIPHTLKQGDEVIDCNKKFYAEEDALAHVYDYFGYKPYKCQGKIEHGNIVHAACGKTFLTNSERNDHYSQANTLEEAMVPCSRCNNPMPRGSYSRYHKVCPPVTRTLGKTFGSPPMPQDAGSGIDWDLIESYLEYDSRILRANQ